MEASKPLVYVALSLCCVDSEVWAMQTAETQVRRLVDDRVTGFSTRQDTFARGMPSAQMVFRLTSLARTGGFALLRIKILLGLGLAIGMTAICQGQDPLNDVHVVPAPPAPSAPADNKPNTPTAPNTTTPAPLEGKKALSARPNERMRVDVNL